MVNLTFGRAPGIVVGVRLTEDEARALAVYLNAEVAILAGAKNLSLWAPISDVAKAALAVESSRISVKG